ncbi:hypothetical protein [Metabacillus idriensis]|uniref:hypothetical protein n=1 Tax=Metabacillus idriensis TaxID=324768 RepID=UPI003D2D567A
MHLAKWHLTEICLSDSGNPSALLSKIKDLLAGMPLLLAGIGGILAGLGGILSFFQIPPKFILYHFMRRWSFSYVHLAKWHLTEICLSDSGNPSALLSKIKDLLAGMPLLLAGTRGILAGLDGTLAFFQLSPVNSKKR